MQADKVKIKGLKISGASRFGYAGICLSSCSDCTIENNLLLSDSYGVHLLNSKGNTISRNTVSDNDRGIYLKFSKGNTLSGNKATDNGEYGIALESSDGNTLSGNTAFKNERGIYFGSSDGNTLTGSTVQNNKIYGLSVCGRCDRNLIFNNYFNDKSMIITSGIGNAYNTEKKAGTNIVGGPYIGGNYWAKPNGTGFSQTAADKNGDGISDSTYTRITGSVNSDYLPLVITSKPPISESKPPTSTLPVVDFWGSPKSGYEPLSVTFTDTSKGTPTAWKWDFGDDTYSTAQNPVHTYSKAGNYAVTLTVSNQAGTDTLTKTNYINVGTAAQKPVADFWGTPKSGNEPLSVTFNDISKGSPTAWKWDFGDGTTSTDQSPTHTYSKAGIYAVTLKVSNAAGTNTLKKANYINLETALQKPVADFWGSPKSGNAPFDVTFTDISTGAPTSWKWDFGDGTYSTQQNPVHTYSKEGKYSVSLTVKNAAGNNSVTKHSYINVITLKTPAAAILASSTSGRVPLNVQFTDKSAGSPTSWNWSFGDGTYSTEKNPAHKYSKAGKYTVTLTVKNEAGSNTKPMSGYITVSK